MTPEQKEEFNVAFSKRMLKLADSVTSIKNGVLERKISDLGVAGAGEDLAEMFIQQIQNAAMDEIVRMLSMALNARLSGLSSTFAPTMQIRQTEERIPPALPLVIIATRGMGSLNYTLGFGPSTLATGCPGS